VAGAVRNVIFDLGGVVFDWNPDHIVSRVQLLATFNLRAEECVFIDDFLANIESAKQVGLHAIWFKDAAQCRRELDQILGNGR
jgi:FMN phosphatase YigB (HAD superfamily)